MSMDRYKILHDLTKKDFPRFRVKLRSESWLRPIFWLLKKITRTDYSGFTTTIFSVMYVGEEWKSQSTEEKYKTLRHEKVHIQQFHRFPLGRWAWPLNHFLMGLCYLLIFPFFLTFRAKFEREGYAQTMLVERELHGKFSDAKMEFYARRIAEIFGTSTYAWMWTRDKAYVWAMRTMRKINAGEITNNEDRVDELRAA